MPKDCRLVNRPVARCLKEKGPDDPFAPLLFLDQTSWLAGCPRDPSQPTISCRPLSPPAHLQSRRRSLILVTPLQSQSLVTLPSPTFLYKSLAVILMSPLPPASLPLLALLDGTTKQPEEKNQKNPPRSSSSCQPSPTYPIRVALIGACFGASPGNTVRAL